MGMAGRLRGDQLGTYQRVVAEYGDVVRLLVGPPGLRRALYLVTHPDGARQVLAGRPGRLHEEHAVLRGDRRVPRRRPAHQRGHQWRQQRRTVAPLFTHRRVAGYAGVMAEEAGRRAIVGGTPPGGGTVDVSAAAVDYALRTVGRILFGAGRRRRRTGEQRRSRCSTGMCVAGG